MGTRAALAAVSALLVAATSALYVPVTDRADAAASDWAATYMPSVTTVPGSGTLNVFYRAITGQVMLRTLRDGTWSAPTNLGGQAVGSPAAALTGTTLRVFVRGTDGALWHRARNGSTWSAWHKVSGHLSTSPAVVGRTNGRIDVVARGPRDGLRLIAFRPGVGWSRWTFLGGELMSAPAAVATGSSSMRVAYVGRDSAVWTRTSAGGSWSAPQSLGGRTYSAPALVVEPTNGRLHLFARGSDRTLNQRILSAGTWSAWQGLGGSIVDGPGAAALGAGAMDVVGRGRDGALHSLLLRGGTWSPWQPPGWTPGPLPALRSSLLGRVVDRIPTTQKVVGLTFDNGGGMTAMESIRATLQLKRVPATFFLTGDAVRNHPIIVNRLVASGFRIANHSDTHPDFKTISDSAVTAEVNEQQAAMMRIAGVETRPLFRFPFGHHDASDIPLVNGLGYTTVGWWVDTLGWKGRQAGITVPKIVSRVLAALRPGAIVLLHVGAARDGSTLDAQALPRVIDALRDRGYRFTTMQTLNGW